MRGAKRMKSIVFSVVTDVKSRKVDSGYVVCGKIEREPYTRMHMGKS